MFKFSSLIFLFILLNINIVIGQKLSSYRKNSTISNNNLKDKFLDKSNENGDKILESIIIFKFNPSIIIVGILIFIVLFFGIIPLLKNCLRKIIYKKKNYEKVRIITTRSSY